MITISYARNYLLMHYGRSKYLNDFIRLLGERNRYERYRTAKDIGVAYTRYLGLLGVWKSGLGMIK